METHEDAALDFKPFFDLVVGILFILLILVASQLFFSRWQDQAVPENAAQQREARRVAALASAETFLTDLAGRLRQAGFTPSVDRLNMALSVPTAELLRPDLTIEAGRIAAFSPSILAALRCAAGHATPLDNCPGQAPRIARVEGRLRLAGFGRQGDSTPDQKARIVALQLSAQLFSSAPDLLSIRSPEGLPVLVTAVPVETFAAGNTSPSTQGVFTLEFKFVDFDKSLP